ncbi:hypothetical protein V2J09_000841 [Rumex salicifolius]
MHSPCGPSISSPCMVDGKCKKYFPKLFVKETNVYDDGYPVYRRRDDGITIEKNEVYLDNRLTRDMIISLLQYQTHLRTFKTILMYPSIQRLSFHLPGEQSIFFGDDDPIDDIIDNVDDRSMFLHGVALTLGKFVIRVYLLVGSITHHQVVHERYYLRVLLNHIKGPKSFEELQTIEDDVREYIDGITESSFWGSTHYLKSLFVFLLVTESMSRPDFVWEQI